MSAARLSYCRLAGVQQCPALASSVPPFDGGGIMGSVGMCVCVGPETGCFFAVVFIGFHEIREQFVQRS